MSRLPPVGTLAERWESNTALRRRIRETGKMTSWKNEKVVGLASVEAMTFNLPALEMLADWWSSHESEPKSVPIDLVRQEAKFGGAKIQSHTCRLNAIHK